MSDPGLGLEKQTKAWSPPERSSGDDRFSRGELSAKGACVVGKAPSSDWGRLAAVGVLRKERSELLVGQEGGSY